MFSKLKNFIQETNPKKKEEKIINFVHFLQKTEIYKSILPGDIDIFLPIYHTKNNQEKEEEKEKVEKFLLKITTPVDSEGPKTTQLVLSESKQFLKEFNMISEESDIYKSNFTEKTFKSSNPIGMQICSKVQHPELDLDLKELAKSFESSINDITRELKINLPEDYNLLEKMNAIIEKANDSSTKLTEPFSWSNGYLSEDQTLGGAISELLLFFTHAKEIAKSDAEWSDKIIPWDAKLETLNNNNNSLLE